MGRLTYAGGFGISYVLHLIRLTHAASVKEPRTALEGSPGKGSERRPGTKVEAELWLVSWGGEGYTRMQQGRVVLLTTSQVVQEGGRRCQQ